MLGCVAVHLSLLMGCLTAPNNGGFIDEAENDYTRASIRTESCYTRQEREYPKSFCGSSKRTQATHTRNNDKVVQAQPQALGAFESTHYIAMCHEGCVGITKTGYDVRETIYTPEGFHIVAVDPAIIPLHSYVRVTYTDGTSFVAQALDTGGAIKGKRLDILVSSIDEAFEKGRVMANVELIASVEGLRVE